MRPFRRRIAQFVERIQGEPSDETIADVIASLPAPARRDVLDSRSEADDFRCLDAILDHAARDLGDAPKEALALADLVLDKICATPGAMMRDSMRLHLHGRAWKERANAQRAMGDLLAALQSFQRAVVIHGQDPVSQVELAAARRGEALVVHQLGESDRALELLRLATTAFEAHQETAGVARSHLYEGVIHFENGRIESAAAAFEKALALCRRLGDEITMARLYVNLGNCAQERGDRNSAVRHYMRALPIFDHAEMRIERQRVAWAMAHFLADDGFVDSAVQTLQSVADEMSRAGMPVDAALARCDLAETLFMAEQHERAAGVARQVLDSLARAGMFREARRMFRILSPASGFDDLDAWGNPHRGDS